MSMVQLTMIQCLLTFFIYTGLTVALPAFVFYPKVAHCRAVTRFFVYFSIGNFFFMNLVYVLELMHISCWLTLVLGTVIPTAAVYVKVHKIPLRKRLRSSNIKMDRVMRGSFGVKNWLRRSARGLAKAAAGGMRFVAHAVRTHAIDCLMALIVMAVVLGFYGPNLIENFGYCTSDVTVHNYWINSIGKNEIFVAGVYPFGFHNMIYYMHAVFRIDTYVLMRVFWLVQVLWIHLVLMVFLKGVCRSRFLPYAGPVIYILCGFIDESFTRYFASLPQEYGMLFILPAVYFAFEFFRIKKEELKGTREKAVSKWYLVGFALNFAMSFSAHFYGTIILGVFCVAIACGYVWRFLQRKYFTKVVSTCVIGLFIALLPMVIAYLSGTMLEGSLRWAMGVMAPGEEQEQDQEEEEQDDREYDENGVPIGAKIVELEDGILAYEDVLEDGSTIYYPLANQDFSPEEREDLIENGSMRTEEGVPEKTYRQIVIEKLKEAGKKLENLFGVMDYAVTECLFQPHAKDLSKWIYFSLMCVPVIALLLIILRRFDEAFSLISVGINILLLMMILTMPNLDMPTVMQQSRTVIYLDYLLPVLWVLTADRALYAVLGVWRSKWMQGLLHVSSLGVAVAGCILVVQLGLAKEPVPIEALQSNEAVTCLTNIIREEPDFSWTIVSAYDEMRMGEDHGYHEELITFLKNMEYVGGISMVTIPSKTVYFFIEKRPIDYTVSYEGSGQMISERGADRMLPISGGFSDYMGENRWILMSRVYEWAQAFQKMYPHDMTVYYEDDNFICYKLKQNDYHLFNLSIDYGYNMR